MAWRNLNSIKNSLTTTVILLCCVIMRNSYVEGESASVAYSCCSVQNTFNGASCDSCIASQHLSEFDTSTHMGQWKVPDIFRENQSEFYLGLETRNASNEFCARSSRIRGKYNVSSSGSSTETIARAGDNVMMDVDKSSFPTFLMNGSMVYKSKLFSPLEYCFDRLSEEGGYTVLDIAIAKDGGCTKYEISSSTRQPYREEWINQLFAAVSGLSCLFTILNVIIYLSLRNYLNVSGWVEFTYFLALGVFSAFSIPAFLYECSSHVNNICYVISVVLQFSEIMMYSSFFMIAFDVYWILRKSDTFASYGEEIQESKIRLVVYLLLISAVPVGVTSYGLVLNHQESVPTNHKTVTVPRYGERSCFAPGWLVTEYLLFGTESATLMVILLSVNHIFGRLSASTDVDDAPSFRIHYCWVHPKEPSTDPIWIVLDGFNYAQGMLAFIVFIFNRKTLKAFRKKAGTDGTLKAIFRHACCSDGSRVDPEDDGTPMSPLMKTSSMRRSTVRQNNLY